MSVEPRLPPTLLLRPVADRKTVSVGVWIVHGAAHDEAELAGATHLLEHLTLRRCGHRSRREIALLVDRLGGEVDAWTGSEAMGLSINTTCNVLPDALDLLRDAVLEPTFDSEDVDLEKRVSLAEMDLLDDDPVEQVEEALLRAAWGRHPLARPIIGSRATIKTLSPDVLRRHHRRLVRPTRLVAAVAGDFDSQQVMRAFADLPLGEPVSHPPVPPVEFRGRHRSLVRRDSDQAHVRLAFPCPAVGDPSIPALTVFNRILGVGVSSRLFQRLREDRGLTYDIWSGLALRSVGGLLEVGWASAPAALPKVWSLVRTEIDGMLAGLKKIEVEVAKDALMRNLMMDTDSTAGLCAIDAGEYLDFGRRFDLARSLDEIRAVDPDEVLAVGRDVVSLDRMASAVCGPEGLDWRGDD